MNAKIATIHSRLGGEPARNNAICRYWMMGKCNRNPAVSRIALPSRWDKLFSGSNDRTVHVWDCGTDQSIIVINLGDKIWALISEGPWIFAWNIETAAEVNLDGPIGQVYAMAVAYVVDMLFAGAQDGAILAWKESTENPKPFELVLSLKGHTTAVICLTIEKNRPCSGSMDNTITVMLVTLLFYSLCCDFV
ncbi:hypothetical protein GH714_012423 [Hevea brasiliensis]|uniref:Uncharacterized protein n=1 Tax=Hevea brasiliensis TaxID=3981 RepID=A0A6A6KQQ1_HEVBR|nr:hypothetical protein GH714_012423 [Hevea brasiliensis]